MIFQESHNHRRKEDESNQTFCLRENRGYIRSSLDGRPVLVVRQADENFVVYNNSVT